MSSVKKKRVKLIHSVKQMLIFPSSRSLDTIKVTWPKKKKVKNTHILATAPPPAPAFCSDASAEHPAYKQSTFQHLEVEATEIAQLKSNY